MTCDYSTIRRITDPTSSVAQDGSVALYHAYRAQEVMARTP